MKSLITTLIAVTALTAGVAGVAYAGTPHDRYNRSSDSSGGNDPQRISNRDGYTPDANRAGDKFDPYTQGARSSTGSALVDDKAKAKKAKPQKKPMTKPMTQTQ